MRETIRLRMPPKSDLLDDIAASPPLAEKLGAVRTGAAAVAFEHVVESARPVLAASDMDETKVIFMARG